MCRSACAWRRRSRPRSPPTSAPMCSRSSHPVAIRCAARRRSCRRAEARSSSSSTPPSARWCSTSRPTPVAPAWRDCSTRPMPACSRSRPRSRALLRAGRATPIEIAAFPVEMEAAARPVSELAIQALGGLMHMVGEPERKPLKLAGHQASYAAGLTAFTGLAAALAARDAGQRRASCARVAGRSDAMGELEGGVRARQPAAPRPAARARNRNSRSCPAATATSPWSTP